jgi:hypothetical protein
MDTHTLITVGITVAVCALIGSSLWFGVKKSRSRRLKDKFGPEYEAVISQTRNQELAEAELENRARRVKKYRIVPLSSQDRENYQELWTVIQNRFIDNPAGAVKDGHNLIFAVMEKRGYPVSNFDQAAADLSVDYPTLVSNYRAASKIAARNRRSEADTEDLRQALVYYRELLRELLAPPEATTEKEHFVSSRVGEIFHKAGV